jgi:glycosyltransferase involved in cell wall biosynthesis
LVPNEQIVTLMREASAVIIPSRHTYAEGLPMTIYEGLCSRTPIVASDHPMFRGRLVNDESALIFHAADANDLATKIQNLFTDSALYQRLSQFSAEAWERIQIPVKFGELLSRWVADSPENRAWLHSYRLASGRYNSLS